MREVLFRGKRLNDEENEWAYGSYVKQYDCDMIYFPTAESDGFDYAHIIPETLGQYTGLTDKNGKKIFEGDIVRYPDSEMFASCEEAINEGVVDWDEEVMCFYFTNRFVVDMADFDIENGRMIDVEVIGNIHDNPELLKGGAE